MSDLVAVPKDQLKAWRDYLISTRTTDISIKHKTQVDELQKFIDSPTLQITGYYSIPAKEE